jgi:hypothetical protein
MVPHPLGGLHLARAHCDSAETGAAEREEPLEGEFLHRTASRYEWSLAEGLVTAIVQRTHPW